MIRRFNVIGCKITALTFKEAVEAAIVRLQQGDGGYVCFTNVHASVMAHENDEFRDVVNSSFMSLPDGKPVYWVGKLLRVPGIEHIPGPDFFPELLSVKRSPALRHYFYGGKQDTLEKLVAAIEKKYPDAEIVGAESPPFRPLTLQEQRTTLDRIRSAQPDFLWVGLGAPKQEFWMARNWEALRPAVLLGVGAAFDFHAEVNQRAPEWMQKVGLEWIHRLGKEPGRLWKRYFYTNSMYFLYLFKQFLGVNK